MFPFGRGLQAMFISIHALTPYAGVLLNRDETGLAKSMPFGGVPRTRVSSQAQKYHWRATLRERIEQGEFSVPDLAVRSRRIFDLRVLDMLVKAGLPEKTAEALTRASMDAILQKSKKGGTTTKATEDETEAETGDQRLATGQAIMLGEREIAFLTDTALKIGGPHGDDHKSAAKALAEHYKSADAKKNLAALPMSLEAALFGRFVTSDLLANTDAAIHVAHAFTVHAAARELDYMTAVDDLVDTGAGFVGDTEITSPVLYGFVVADVRQLVGNLGGDRELAARLVEEIGIIIATGSIGAKLGSTAPYSRAAFVMIEASNSQPRSLAAAFETPVKAENDGGYVRPSIRAVADYLAREREMYGEAVPAVYASLHRDIEIGDRERLPLAKVLSFAARAVITPGQSVGGITEK